ncbi:MAG: xylulose 5-phosphate 3-epimerase [Patescibacteria group bacterium]|nr:xylulose 5-phosphate 3-epimerase [Patescibacteria group bacterium]
MIYASSAPPEKRWKRGYGVIRHSPITQKRVASMISYLKQNNLLAPHVDPYEILHAADLLASAGMWLVVHSTYASRVYLDGRVLGKEDFKKEPEGHTGGSLNVTPGYVGYLAMNALMGKTRAWTMEQGHVVAAIDSVNLLVGNMKQAHSERYSLSDEGLTRFVQDFYSFRLNDKGKQDSPRGSHVNHFTGGGFLEGGYLGFASVQYVHMPLPHERLVVFLSDGAFEEQRGGDWAPRFWRAEDSGLVTPIMIFNGRRIDQRSTVDQTGGPQWFAKYLKLHNFDPIIFDGRDPAAFAWAIFEMELRLKRYVKAIDGPRRYPIPLPYGIAVAPKGAGFYGEGTNDAHNLPLGTNPYEDELARERFNYHAKRLWVPKHDLEAAIALVNNHEKTNRIREKDHPIANRQVTLANQPQPVCKNVSGNRLDMTTISKSSPMEAIDTGFVRIVKENPHLRPRVGNPDEIRSNKMLETLEYLKFRAESPEGGNIESTSGHIITVLNEEAIAGAAFGNKGGINIIVTYEAFGAKIFGEARQEVIFAQHLKETHQGPYWLSVPIILSSHLWENGKNEQSHQDPSMAESMYGEMSYISRVFFPADYNTASTLIHEVYKTQGQIWTIVCSKRKTHDLFSQEEAYQLFHDGGMRISWTEHEPEKAALAMIAIGSYQLGEVLKASARLRGQSIPHIVLYLLEPGRFRIPRSDEEMAFMTDDAVKRHLLPDHVRHVQLITHTRPEVIAGSLLQWFGNRSVSQFGFINHGGTLDANGLLFVNKSSWAHLLRDAARHLTIDEGMLLSQEERDALDGKRSPDGIIRPI